MQGMRDFLRGSLARSLRTLPAEDRLAAALPIVCGTALAGHCEVGWLDEAEVLHLRVNEREWMGPLLAMRDVLCSDLARTAGVPLQGLHFEAGRSTEPTAKSAPGASQPQTFRNARSRSVR